MENNLTTYYARITNPFVWLAALLMFISAGARIAYYSSQVAVGGTILLFHILLPIAANLMFAIWLLIKGEKQLYVTITPVIWFCMYFLVVITALPISLRLTISCIIMCVFSTLLYVRTLKGLIKTHWLILFIFAVITGIITFWPKGVFFLSMGTGDQFLHKALQLSDSLITLGLFTAMLAVRKMPPIKEGEPYRLHFGDRIDGRLVLSIPPMSKLSSYFLSTRNAASNLMKDKIEITPMERYIHQKRKEGLKHFGITHVILAAYVRTIADLPGLNRFISGQKIYSRFQIVVNMVVKKNMDIESPDTVIKIIFDPSDTATDVYGKYDIMLQKVRTPTLDSSFDNLAKYFDYIPGLILKFTVWFIGVLDYFGNIPKLIIDLSPFHGSLFITSLGSLGVPPVYHHLYDFGNIPVFCAFGCKRSVHEINEDGSVTSRKYLDYTFVSDERIVDGFYYAAAFKRMRAYMTHPERLDLPPEKLVSDIL